MSDDDKDDKFTIKKGDLEVTEEGEGPSLAELAKAGKSFYVDDAGKVIIVDDLAE